MTQTTLLVPHPCIGHLKQLERLAKVRQVAVSVLIEEALEAYLEAPENYLDQADYRSNRKRWRYF